MSFPRPVIPKRVYLVTRRCTQRQFLLRPDKATNNAFIYCLAYAAKCTGVEIVAFVANSNHYHAVVTDVEGCIPQFLERFHKLLAKHQNALRGRWENFWSSEQTSLVELVDGQDILDKVVYTLCNPVKDHSVERCDDWPGALSRRATVDGEIIHAVRPTRFFRPGGKMPDRIAMKCARPAVFEHLTDDEYRSRLTEAISKAEADALRERQASGRRVLGRKRVLKQNPTDRPRSREPRRRLNPRVAGKKLWVRLEAKERLKAFRTAYAEARANWLLGKTAHFPPGTWWLQKFAKIPSESAPDLRAA
jgi:putative transposase